MEAVRILNKTEIKLEYDVCEESNSGITVIIVAAGNSSRMNGADKQLLKIGSIPVIVRTLMAFESSKSVKRIILVTKEESVLEMQLMAERYMITKLSDIVCGGNSRQESVLNGFKRLSENDSAVIIHDGARPLVSDNIIRSVTDGLENHSAVTCAVKIKDTVKQVGENGKIIKTLDRNSLVAVQTPQGVRVKEYLKAIEKAGDISQFTDDTSIMEAAGFDVYTVEGSYKNIKITTPEDINLAESYLSEVEE